MMYINSLILGIVQGLTEFLPVSSSGHLVILHNILNFDIKQNLFFDVALHLGTALAIFVFFYKDWFRYIKAFFRMIARSTKSEDRTDLDMIFKIIVATIPAVILGLIFSDLIENKLHDPGVVVIALGIIALTFFWIEKKAKQDKLFSEITFGQSFLVGLAQAVALIPGVSRSGITIVTGMYFRLARAEAAKFSFLLSFPVILGAGFLKIMKFDFLQMESTLLLSFAIGFLGSFVIGLFAIKYFIKFSEKYSLRPFAYYRIGLAIVVVLYFYFR